MRFMSSQKFKPTHTYQGEPVRAVHEWQDENGWHCDVESADGDYRTVDSGDLEDLEESEDE